MRLRALQPYLPLGLAFIGAILLTFLATWLDFSRRNSAEVDRSLRIARQVVSQAEGMIWSARVKQEPDPVSSAVKVLSQGAEPRVLRIYKVQEKAGQSGEFFSHVVREHAFDYTKILTPENGVGLRVRVALDYIGFLGARSALAHDLSVLAFFLVSGLIFGTVALRPQWIERITGNKLRLVREDTTRASALVDSFLLPGEEQVRLRERARAKARELKDLLTQLGTHVRDLVRGARDVTASAAESQKSLSSLRTRMSVGIRELHDTRAALKEVGDSAIQAEITALNLVVEIAKKDIDPKRIGEMAEVLHQIATRMRDLNQRSEAALGRIEHQVQPMASDAEAAHRSFDELFRHTRDIDTHIRKSTETLIGQARLVQNLNAELAEPKSEQAVQPELPRIAIQ